MLAKKLELSDYNRLGDYLYNGNNAKGIDFLNNQLIKYINEGKLTNWLVYKVKKTSINQLEENIDIKYFWRCYCSELAAMGLDVPSDFSDIELEKLQRDGRHVFENSICEFNEAGNPQYVINK